MALDWRVVPIKSWPTQPTAFRRDSPFGGKGGWQDGVWKGRSGVQWGPTMSLLQRELEMLDAKNILLQLQVTDKDLRQDGWIKEAARPTSPGVILSFNSMHGPLSYPCDTFTDWQSNVRAIALALEALRKVDRYGVTKRGEQYSGFKQIGSGKLEMTPQLAAELLCDQAQEGYEVDDVLCVPAILKHVVRYAVKKAHPDAGGSAQAFQLVQEAKAVLERHHGITT